ncbi:unnamed protein product [Polarella glacialis]|uniref:Uncharacterized protein n=1 Tax=Polarella glacialis TaxID=89957 RepID=A0A813GJ33_POLGL|nr:unnamed protein product [Polarella glacialis]
MAPRASKQADRNSKKKTVEADEPTEGSPVTGSIVERAKEVAMGSCLAEVPQMHALLADDLPEPKESKDENSEGEEVVQGSAEGLFSGLKARLAWHNPLGLAATPEESMESWLAMKGLQVDFGPRARKRGSPAVERITANLYTNLPQYIHLLLALMMLRSFLFRSYFACLPWLVAYQLLSLAVPLTTMAKFELIPQIPVEQVPLDKVPVKFRVAGTMAIHALIWLFLVYEAVWRTYFFEKVPVIGLFAYHAYAVKPIEQ